MSGKVDLTAPQLPIGLPLVYSSKCRIAQLLLPTICDNYFETLVLWYELFRGLRSSSVNALRISCSAMGVSCLVSLLNDMVGYLASSRVKNLHVTVANGLL